MNIYYIHQDSKLKGPYDIVDSHRYKIIKIGDVVIRNTYDGLFFLLVLSSNNTWKHCLCVDKTSYKKLSIKGNLLLFSFNGISKRYGAIEAIHELKDFFNNDIICQFFSNALDILQYKCDFWDLAILKKIYSSSHSVQSTQSRKKTNITLRENYVTLFENYLAGEAHILFRQHIENNDSIRKSYEAVRNKYPKVFSCAIKQFIHDNPTSSIYDKPLS